MNKRLYKTYVNLTNIIVRISDGSDRGKEHAVLVNAHLDSTLPSPGAADDALAVGVMLECMRVLVHSPDWEPQHAIIFCESCLPRSSCSADEIGSVQPCRRVFAGWFASILNAASDSEDVSDIAFSSVWC